MQQIDHMVKDILNIGGHDILPGEQVTINLPVPEIYPHSQTTMPVKVLRSMQPGPRIFLSAAIHGDEVVGVEILRSLMVSGYLSNIIRGDIIIVPVANVLGFIVKSRYLPDRRDLNRSFPGSENGSIASRMAHLFIKEIASKCQYGIDLHSAAVHRTNFPQIRADLDDPEILSLAESFNTPVILDSEHIEGSLRKTAIDLGIKMLLYEGGEALRYDEEVVAYGVRGILNVLTKLGMVEYYDSKVVTSYICRSSNWVRAPKSGIFRSQVPLGGFVTKGSVVGVIVDPLGENETYVAASKNGIIIGQSVIPVINEGEALFHIASTDQAEIRDNIEAFFEENESTNLIHGASVNPELDNQ